MKATKAYIWVLGTRTITTKLVKNSLWRWRSTSTDPRQVDAGSDALTHWGAIRQLRRKWGHKS